MLELQAQLLLLLAVGIVLGKLGLLSPATRQQLTDIVLDVILPCSIVSSFQVETSPQLARASLTALAAAFGAQLLYWVLNHFLYRSFPEDEGISCRYSTMVSNAGFLGIPVVFGLYGSTGMLLASIFVIPQRIFMWAYGLPMYTTVSKREAARHILTHPCIVSIAVGLVVMAFYTAGYRLPTVVASTLDALGGCTTPLCFLVIGSIVSEINPRHLLDRRALLFSFYRLLLIPGVLLLCLFWLPVDPLVRNVTVVLSAMPAATTTVMLAQKYHRSPEFASKLLVTSTLLSMATIPLVTAVLGLL